MTVYISKFRKLIFWSVLLLLLPNTLFSNKFIFWEKIVAATNLPPNSSVVPFMAKDSWENIGIIYQSIEMPG